MVSWMDPVTQSLWNLYVAAEMVRIRDESLRALDTFIQRLLQIDERERHSWARTFALKLESETAQVPLRMPLFSRIIFPALLAGIHAQEPDSARCLAGFSQLLYQSRECQSL